MRFFNSTIFPSWSFFRCHGDKQLFCLIFSCDQAALWMVQSAGLSVCLSFHHTFFIMFPSLYHEIFRSYYQCQVTSMQWVPYCFSRSSVKFQGRTGQKTSILTQIWRFRTVTLVWINWRLWNDAQSSKQHRGGALVFPRSTVNFLGHKGKKIANFYPNWAFPDCNSTLNSSMALKWCTKLNVV